MKFRGLFAWIVACGLIFSLPATPSNDISDPVLVCRLTGTIMPAQTESAGGVADDSNCCTVRVSALPNGTPYYALSPASCCDLKQTPERTSLPAILNASSLPDMAGWLPFTPHPAYLPYFIEATPLPREWRSSAPRAPPFRSAASPRAPPLFS